LGKVTLELGKGKEGREEGDGALCAKAELVALLGVAEELSSGLFIGGKGRFASDTVWRDIFSPRLSSARVTFPLSSRPSYKGSGAQCTLVCLLAGGQLERGAAMVVATVGCSGATTW
jgi:hypothetical protein